MKLKSLLILIGIAIVLAGLAHRTSRRQARPAPAGFGEPLLPDIPLDHIAAVTIQAPAGTVTLSRGHDGWQVEEFHNYPANTIRLRRLLLTLVDLKAGQQIPVDAGTLHELELTADTMTRLTLADEAGRALADLQLGATRTGQTPDHAMMGMGPFPDGRFVSPDDGQSVFLIRETLHEVDDIRPRDWARRELLSVPGRELARIRITGPDRAPVDLRRDAANTWTLTDPAPGETLDRNKLFAVEGALAHLQLAGVADPDLPATDSGLDNPVVFEAQSDAGIVYRVTLGDRHAGGNDRYGRIRVAFEPDAEGDDSGEADDEAAASRDELEREAAALDARLAPWIYILPSYQADSMMRERDSLLKEPEPEDASPATEPGDADERDDGDHGDAQTGD